MQACGCYKDADDLPCLSKSYEQKWLKFAVFTAQVQHRHVTCEKDVLVVEMQITACIQRF
jgi:hypothetical protein